MNIPKQCGVGRLAASAIVLIALVCGAVAQETRARPDGPYRRWDGEAVTRNCRADLGDLDSFKETLERHEFTRVGFRRKMMFNFFSTPEFFDSWIFRVSPNDLVGKISENLRNMDWSGRTAALVYDVGLSDGKYSLCSWLLSREGLVAAHTQPLPDLALTRIVQSGLKVTTRAAARAPVPRQDRATRQRSQDAAEDRDLGILQAVIASPDAALRYAASLLIPRAIEKEITSGRLDRLLILTSGDLSTVPFAALPVEGRPLIGFASIVILADVSGLFFPAGADDHAAARPRAYARFIDRDYLAGGKLIVGDPDASHDRKWRFWRLRHARSEAESVARSVSASALTGRRASHAAVWSELRRPNLGLIYFATHGIADPDNPMDESFLALTHRHLYAREIKTLDLKENAPLVVMSACQSGLGKVFEGGVFGLARAWYHVGAPQVVMSLWDIDDEATMMLMVDFMDMLGRGQAPEEALRDAMLEARNRTTDQAKWSGFAVYGGATLRR